MITVGWERGERVRCVLKQVGGKITELERETERGNEERAITMKGKSHNEGERERGRERDNDRDRERERERDRD